MALKARVVVAALAVLGALSWWMASTSGDAPREWVRVQRGDLVLTVEVSGTLRSLRSDVLTPPMLKNVWEYKIARMAPEGSEVKKGAPVLGFDTTDLERQLLEKRAEYDSAQKEIEKKEADLESRLRQDRLRLAEAEAKERKAELKLAGTPDVVAARELEKFAKERELARKEITFLTKRLASIEEAGRAQLSLLRGQRDRAAARVRELQEGILRMSVAAPRDGTVVYTPRRGSGEKKKVGDSTWIGETIMEIPNLERMMAEGEADEVDAGRIATGERVSLRLDAYPEMEFTGRVSSVGNTVQRASSRSPLKIVRVNITLDSTDPQRMRPGMRFRSVIETDRAPDVLLVPAEAVLPGPLVYKRGLTGPEPAKVVLGKRDARRVEVQEGLSEGDVVAVAAKHP